MARDANHERAVSEFFQQARLSDPRAYAAACERAAVLSQRQTYRLLGREFPISQLADHTRLRLVDAIWGSDDEVAE